MKYKRTENKEWDFSSLEKSNYSEYTHNFHKYPAMMIPQVARKIIDDYGNTANNILDPYCGTGTSLVEASIKGIDSVGIDLNPLARLISKVKTNKIDDNILSNCLNEFNKKYSNLELNIPNVINIDYWFKKDVQLSLGKIKTFIESIDNDDVKDFFKLVFSETIRDCSLVRNGEFKMYRIPEDKIDRFNPNVLDLFNKKALRNIDGIKSFNSLNAGKADILDINTSFTTGNLLKDSFDLVVTSPPYGDSRTTVAYGQFSRLSSEWLSISDAGQVDNILMGGKTKKVLYETGVESIDSVVKEISNNDLKRAGDVLSFLDEYRMSINNVSNLIKSGGYSCYVVGNRTVKGVYIDLDQITAELFEMAGFTHIDIQVRSISNKRMPSKNSPSNVIGDKVTTMTQEFIVVSRKN